MNVLAWVLTAVLALVLLGAGVAKLIRSKESLGEDPRMAWTEDFSEPQIKGIGALEVLGAVGLILPALLHKATFLVPLAATGLALVMIGAIVTHARRNEPNAIVMPAVLAVIAIVVAVLRFGPYPL